jgi:hypothetical protein
MADEAGSHVPATRRQWDEHMSDWFEQYAHPQWAATEPYWGDLVHSAASAAGPAG